MTVASMVFAGQTSSVIVIWAGWVRTALLIAAVMGIATVQKALVFVTSVKVNCKQKEIFSYCHNMKFLLLSHGL